MIYEICIDIDLSIQTHITRIVDDFDALRVACNIQAVSFL